MARIDLNVGEMTLLARSIELHAEQLAATDNTELVLELSLIHLKLLQACKESLERDRRAMHEEYGV